MARTLRTRSERAGKPLSQAEALEAMAAVFGVSDWNTLSGRIKARDAETTGRTEETKRLHGAWHPFLSLLASRGADRVILTDVSGQTKSGNKDAPGGVACFAIGHHTPEIHIHSDGRLSGYSDLTNEDGEILLDEDNLFTLFNSLCGAYGFPAPLSDEDFEPAMRMQATILCSLNIDPAPRMLEALLYAAGRITTRHIPQISWCSAVGAGLVTLHAGNHGTSDGNTHAEIVLRNTGTYHIHIFRNTGITHGKLVRSSLWSGQANSFAGAVTATLRALAVPVEHQRLEQALESLETQIQASRIASNHDA